MHCFNSGSPSTVHHCAHHQMRARNISVRSIGPSMCRYTNNLIRRLCNPSDQTRHLSAPLIGLALEGDSYQPILDFCRLREMSLLHPWVVLKGAPMRIPPNGRVCIIMDVISFEETGRCIAYSNFASRQVMWPGTQRKIWIARTRLIARSIQPASSRGPLGRALPLRSSL